MQRPFASVEDLEDGTLCRLLRWSSGLASVLSAVWVPLLLFLILRCKLTGAPIPVLGKFAPFRFHFALTDRMLSVSPFFVVSALILLVTARYVSRNTESVRSTALLLGASVAVSVVFAAGNPGGYFTWLLS